MSAFSDKTMTCRDCGAEFIWTAGEQEFYQQKGFQYPPARCPKCRDAKKQQTAAGFDIVCAKCGKPAKVKFQPKGDRPVYCFDCYKAMQADSQPNAVSVPAADDSVTPAATKTVPTAPVADPADQTVPASTPVKTDEAPAAADPVPAEETAPQA